VLRVVERLAAEGWLRRRDPAERQRGDAALLRKPADLAMLDLRMPDVNDWICCGRFDQPYRAARSSDDRARRVDSAVEAIKRGAREYLTKPFDFDRLREVLVEIREELERRAQVVELESQVARQLEILRDDGPQPVMQELFSLNPAARASRKSSSSAVRPAQAKSSRRAAFHQAGPTPESPFVTIKLLDRGRHAVRDASCSSRARRVHGRRRVEARTVRGGAKGPRCPRRDMASCRCRCRRSAAALDTAKCSASIAAAEEGRRGGDCCDEPRFARRSARPLPDDLFFVSTSSTSRWPLRDRREDIRI